MADSATYVYCVVHSDRKAPPGRMPGGIPGSSRPVLLDLSPRLSIVVSSVPLDRYGPEQIQQRLGDLEWVAGIAVAHEGVVERMRRISSATVIPMKLFTMFSGPERALVEMRSRRRQLEALVKRIRGCDEWGVRVILATGGADRMTEPKRRVTSGAAFLAAKRQARDGARERAAKQVEAAESALVALSRLARDSKRRAAPESATAPPLLDAAFLVPKDRLARFKSAARHAADRCRTAGTELMLTGPWPAYNFIDVEETAP